MEYWPVFLAILAVLLGIYYYVFKDLNYFKKHNIPYIEPWPVLGNMAPIVFFRTSIAELITKIYNIHPEAKYVGMFDFMYPVVVIRDPEIIKSIAVKNFDIFMDHRAFIDENQDALFGKNLFSLRGEKWKEIRNLLSPAFTSSKMKSMFVLMSNCAVEFAEYLSKLPQDKQVLELKDVYTRYTNDVIATCAFGISINSLKEPKNDFYVYGKRATTFTKLMSLKAFAWRNFPAIAKILGIRILDETVSKFFENVIRTTIRTRKEKGIQRPDMIQLMIESRNKAEPGKEMTLEEMVAQAFIFFFGGFDTVSSAMCFTSHELAVNPEVQKRLQEEIDEAFAKNNGVLTYEAVSGMEYLDAVLNESMRYYTLAVFADRMCAKDFELPPALPGMKPHVVKKGMNVIFPLYPMHHDPKYFDDPDTFNPDRFINEGRKILSSGHFMPFGLGPRICIGNRFALLECKVLLCHLLARCDLKCSPKTQVPLKFAKGVFTVTAEKGFWVKIEPRKNPATTAPITNGTANA